MASREAITSYDALSASKSASDTQPKPLHTYQQNNDMDRVSDAMVSMAIPRALELELELWRLWKKTKAEKREYEHLRSKRRRDERRAVNSARMSQEKA